MQHHKGRFITLEGVEGVGKSTAISFLEQQLHQRAIPFALTREPGGTGIAECIRDILLRHHDEPMASDTELLLMFAGRAQNIARVIKPALAAGQWVIADRFVDASFAYQGGGRGIVEERINTLSEWVLGDLTADLTLLLDAPVDLGFRRLQSRGHKDRIEVEDIAFFERIRATYLQRAKQFPQRMVVIDASLDIPAVEEQLVHAISPLIERYWV